MFGNKEKIIAMIPARMGSTRLPMKNLALLNGKPLIYYAIQAAKKAHIFDKVVINSEDRAFSEIAKRYRVSFYKRTNRLATSQAKSDFVVYDFIKNNPCDIIAWVNPTSPLQTGKEIRGAIEFFIKKHLDSLITVKNENVHCVYKNRSINFRNNTVFAKTQDLKPVQPFVYSVMIWRSDVFIRTFEKKGYALLCGKKGFYPVSKLSSIIIKTKEDFILAERLIGAVNKEKNYKVKYDKITKTI